MYSRSTSATYPAASALKILIPSTLDNPRSPSFTKDCCHNGSFVSGVDVVDKYFGFGISRDGKSGLLRKKGFFFTAGFFAGGGCSELYVVSMTNHLY